MDLASNLLHDAPNYIRPFTAMEFHDPAGYAGFGLLAARDDGGGGAGFHLQPRINPNGTKFKRIPGFALGSAGPVAAFVVELVENFCNFSRLQLLNQL
jgi:hypothetical protein